MPQKTQKLIERAKQEWESTVDSLPQLICLLDKQGHIMRANRTVEHWNLASVVEVKELCLHRLLHPNCTDSTCYLASFWLQAKKELTQCNPVEYEVEDKTLNRHLCFQVQPVQTRPGGRDSEKSASFAVAVIDDISDRKRAEELLKLTQFSIDRAAEAVFWIGSEGEFLYVNNTACRFLGYTRAELLSMSFGDIDPHYPVEIWPMHWQTTKERGPITIESHHHTKAGERVPVEVTFNHLEFGDKEYNCTFVRDITWRRWSAEALHQSNTELQARNEELDAFAHTVAHDLKNPLNTITGYAEFLEATINDEMIAPNEEWLSCLQTIAQTGRKMSRITDELLLLAEMHKTEVELKPLDMADIVTQAQQRLYDMTKEYQAEIILPSVWPVVLGHSLWIEEVWINYLSNAMKYGGQPPCIKLGASMQANGMVRFWIQDNGPGLSLEEQAQLFTPFTRLDQVHVQGYGLGLSIVQRIVEKLDGQVGVESNGAPDHGSVFFFTLQKA